MGWFSFSSKSLSIAVWVWSVAGVTLLAGIPLKLWPHRTWGDQGVHSRKLLGARRFQCPHSGSCHPRGEAVPEGPAAQHNRRSCTWKIEGVELYLVEFHTQVSFAMIFLIQVGFTS